MGKILKNKNRYLIIIPLVILIIVLLIWQPWETCPSADDNSFYTYSIQSANFSEDYVSKNKGKLNIQILEVYELVHIVMALTDYAKQDPYLLNKKGDYYSRVMEYFKEYDNHPIVKDVNNTLNESGYYRIKNNALAYHFDKNNIVKGSTYKIFPGYLENNIDLFLDFAKQSNFRKFYKNNSKYYQQQIELYREEVPVRKIWEWLETLFPLKYDNYKVIMSPLAGASHNTVRYRDKNKDYFEAIIYIAGVDYYFNQFNKNKLLARGIMVSNTFTEIDHNYVNKITDKNIQKVIDAFCDIYKWNKQNSSNYAKASFTFNEYMTWSLFSLFAYDHYDDKSFEIINNYQIRLMEQGRNFVKYGEFNNKMLEFYNRNEKEKDIEYLYSEILSWAENN